MSTIKNHRLLPLLVSMLAVCCFPAAADAGRKAAPKLNLHTAPVHELARLPGIGPKLADAIGRYRSFSGRAFHSLDQLTQIRGITPAMVNKLRSRATLTPAEKPVVRTFFIEGSSGNYSGKNYIDLDLTEFGLNAGKFQKLVARRRVSQRRFIQVTDPLIAPGRGSGRVKLEGREFNIRYAWRGRGHSYTVRLEPVDGKPYKPTVSALFEGITRDENRGKLEKKWTEPRAKYLRKHYGVKDNSLRTLRRVLMKKNTALLQELRKLDAERGTNLLEGLTAQKMTEQTVSKLKHKRTIEQTRLLRWREIRPEEL